MCTDWSPLCASSGIYTSSGGRQRQWTAQALRFCGGFLGGGGHHKLALWFYHNISPSIPNNYSWDVKLRLQMSHVHDPILTFAPQICPLQWCLEKGTAIHSPSCSGSQFCWFFLNLRSHDTSNPHPQYIYPYPSHQQILLLLTAQYVSNSNSLAFTIINLI